MKRKQGISLIVLVITIIVMIILAASVVLTLSNSGIINKANEAVEKTNIKEVEQLASLAWAEEFMAGKRGETLKTAVLEKLKDYTDKYTITVTDTGVTVTEAGKLNEYGFYYDTVYSNGEYAAVATKSSIVEFYYYDEQLGTYWLDHRESATYEKGKIIFEAGYEVVVSDNGKTLADSKYPDDKLEYTTIEYKDVYYNQKYYMTQDRDASLLIGTNNTISFYYDGEFDYSEPIVKNGHILNLKDEIEASISSDGSANVYISAPPSEWRISIDGKFIKDNDYRVYMLANENEIVIYGDCIGYNVCKIDEGMTWEEWVNSSYNTIGIVINEYDRVVPNCCSNHKNKGSLRCRNLYE